MCTSAQGYDESALAAAQAGWRRVTLNRIAAITAGETSDADRAALLKVLCDDLRVEANGRICAALRELLPEERGAIVRLEQVIEEHAWRTLFPRHRAQLPCQ